MFADYRVPQLLRALGIIKYSEELADAVDHRRWIQPGSPWEIEIRANTLQACLRIRDAASMASGVDLLDIEVDWQLWQIGETTKESLLPHHRCLTVFY